MVFCPRHLFLHKHLSLAALDFQHNRVKRNKKGVLKRIESRVKGRGLLRRFWLGMLRWDTP